MKLSPLMLPARFRALLFYAVPVLGVLAALVATGISGGEADLFMPHAHCYLFNRELMMLHGWSDLFIGLSYVSISATLIYLVVRARDDLPFHWMMLAFALFIVACGATHFMEVWTLRAPQPEYWLAGWVKLVTATASLLTAVVLPPLVPKIRGVLQSARLAAERKTELEKAYSELVELYGQAVGTTDPRLLPVMPSGRAPAGVTGGEQSLAQMAKEVSVHARALEQARQSAEAANRAKDQFLAVLSHELRTPLTPALAAASHLENATELDPKEVRESLALIRRNIELEARLVDDLLDVTRINRGKLEVHRLIVDVHGAIGHALEMCQSAAHHQRPEISVHLDAAEHFVLGDAARLAQIFWNLILNAVKFTPAHGRISIRTLNAAPGAVRIEVRDDGIGIEASMLTKIFDPFQQGDNAGARQSGGVGLGLSIAKGLVDAHGGRILALSEGRDRGSSLVIELTTVAPPAPREEQAPSGPAKSAARSLRILLVEDHEDTRQALARLLKRQGHVVAAAATVAQALEVAPGFAPEMLLSDVGLPDGTGMEVLRHLRQTSALPAIAMSGYGMESDLEQTKAAGFDAHLVKPVAALLLKETIERLSPAQP